MNLQLLHQYLSRRGRIWRRWLLTCLTLSLVIVFGSPGSLAQYDYGYPRNQPTPPPTQPIATPTLDTPLLTRGRIAELERNWQGDFTEYFQTEATGTALTADEIARDLAQLRTDTNHRYGLIYIFPNATEIEIILVTSEGSLTRVVQTDVNDTALREAINDFRRRLVRPNSNLYRSGAQQLYTWLIAPIAGQLEADQVDTLMFCVGGGVRSLPFAALYDGQQFLIERYSLGLIPAFSLTDPRHARQTDIQVLAMGASEFNDLSDLPAVPLELQAIAQTLDASRTFLNADFTIENLQQALQNSEIDVIHLATHANFTGGDPNNSFIQFWQDQRLGLLDMAQLDWGQQSIELLVLSACQTAVGDAGAELGFAGLSYQSGVKSTLASLWSVSDQGTLTLMQEFYRQLVGGDVTTKAAALQNAQLSLLRQRATSTNELDLSHPFYWAAFTLVGSPW